MDGDELDQLFLLTELQLCQELGRTLMLNKQQAVQRIQMVIVVYFQWKGNKMVTQLCTYSR